MAVPAYIDPGVVIEPGQSTGSVGDSRDVPCGSPEARSAENC